LTTPSILFINLATLTIDAGAMPYREKDRLFEEIISCGCKSTSWRDGRKVIQHGALNARFAMLSIRLRIKPRTLRDVANGNLLANSAVRGSVLAIYRNGMGYRKPGNPEVRRLKAAG
jgi:hypothetical protein